MRFDSVPSTQDVAREHVDDLPLLVIAASQTRGRGRSGAYWTNADRALAVSIAFRHEDGDRRPFSLIAGVAAVRALPEVTLKWPNDVLRGDSKVGGLLVERADDLTVIGMGVNLWWSEAADGAGALFESDPGDEVHAQFGALWGAELLDMIDGDDWPLAEYRSGCVTVGQEIAWEPNGVGLALDVAEDGALVVETAAGEEQIYSGAVRHVRPSGF